MQKLILSSMLAILLTVGPIPVKAENSTTQSPFKFSIDINFSEAIKTISAVLEQWFVAYPTTKSNDVQRQDLLKVGALLSEISGRESVLAYQLDAAIQQAIRTGADRPIQDILNLRLDQVRDAFEKLQNFVGGSSALGQVEPKLLAGLHCFVSDSVLFGLPAPCFDRGQSSSARPSWGGGQIFSVGPGGGHHAAMAVVILKQEARDLLELATQIHTVANKM